MGKTVKYYQTSDGKEPFADWINSFRKSDRRTYSRILDRLDKLAYTGEYGDHKYLGEGVYEMKFYYGPGYRIYFAEEGGVLVILLCGGDKSSQQRDILKAKAYWREYRERNH